MITAMCFTTMAIYIRAETNIRFARIFARLHKYLNTKKVFRYTENVTGLGKTDHNVTFCIPRNTVLKH